MQVLAQVHTNVFLNWTSFMRWHHAQFRKEFGANMDSILGAHSVRGQLSEAYTDCKAF